MKHYFIVPARKNSKGFKNKNRILLSKTFKFLETIKWKDRVILSTDDDFYKEICYKKKYLFLKRPKILSGDKISIKNVLIHAKKNLLLESDSYIWLIYIPILGRKTIDYNLSKRLIEKSKFKIKSLCSFFPSKDHPFNTWKIQNNKLTKYIENDIFRRQDLPTSLIHHHYISVTSPDYLEKVNSELISNDTYPLIFNEKKREKIHEIDTILDYKKYLKYEKKYN